LLKAEFDMLPDRDFKTTFSGKHDNSILGVANKDTQTVISALIKQSKTLLRIPTQSGHCFQSKAATESNLKRPPIPTQSGQS
jgi:hypothetical protein